MRPTVLVAGMLIAAVACRAGTPVAGDGSPTPGPDATQTTAPTAVPTTEVTPTRTGAAPSPTALSPAPEPRPFETIGSVDDPRGDAGAEARPYNDLRGVRIQDDGERARILIRVAGDIPNPMPSGEQMGLGVELFRTAQAQESAYQFFAAGTDQGWEAFLRTPQGFVQYQRDWGFGPGGQILEFTVPWSALGDISSGSFIATLDWDREAIAVGFTGHDRAPDEGRARFER